MLKILHVLTTEQWQKINEHYVSDKKRLIIDWKAISIFLVFTGVLIVLKYFGKSSTFTTLFADTFQTWPYPHIYSHLYWALFRVLMYFFLPTFLITGVFKESICSYGFRFDTRPTVLLIYLAMFFVVIPLVFIVSHHPNFLHTYPFYPQAAHSWTELLLWELSYAAQFLALEFFFRGFVLLSLARYIGAYAIFFMAVPYTMIHFQKPLPETLGAIFAGVALGTLALRTRSIFGGVFIHVAVAWSMDLMALFQKGELQKVFK